MNVVVRELGLTAYTQCWRAMSQFTNVRTPACDDEFWLVQHPAVFTLGRAGKREHILCQGDIPVVESDRGGQVTFHGPGQLVVYTLLDIRRLALGPRELVRRIEQGVIDYLATLNIDAKRRAGAPGVYVNAKKIAALGLRIRKGCSFHGLALNVAMDLEPYQRINPCGYAGLEATQLADEGVNDDCARVGRALLPHLWRELYPQIDIEARYVHGFDTVNSALVAGTH